MIPAESRVFTLPHHPCSAFKVMRELWERGELCDVVLCVGCHEFPAHRVVLAGSSPYLRAMFTNGMQETSQPSISIHGIEPSVMENLVRFMYTGSIEVTIGNVQALLHGASLLNMASLRTICCQFLQLHMDVTNCLGIQCLADMYSCSEMEAVASRFIYQHFLDVCRQDEFLELPQSRLIELLKSDRLQVTSEEQVFEAAVAWIEHRERDDNDNTRRHDDEVTTTPSCQVLQHVRLGLVAAGYLEGVVARAACVGRCARCQKLVAAALRSRQDPNPVPPPPRSQPQGIFVLGGRNSIDCQLKTMERYDMLKDQWIPMGSMAIARTAVGAAALNGLLYGVGGECAVPAAMVLNDGNANPPPHANVHLGGALDTVYLGCVEAYDPALRAWRSVAPLQVPRSFVAVCAVGKHLYAIGGEDRAGSYDIVEQYSPKSNTWTVVASMKRKRAGAGVAVCHGKIYVAGGYDKALHTDRASVEMYEPDSGGCGGGGDGGGGEWTFVGEMEKARSGLALVALNHFLYAFGGRSRHIEQYYDIAERFNTWTLQWTTIAALQRPRAWPSAAVLGDQRIYVIGGFDGANRLRCVEVYDPDADAFAFVANMNVCRAGGAAAIL